MPSHSLLFHLLSKLIIVAQIACDSIFRAKRYLTLVVWMSYIVQECQSYAHGTLVLLVKVLLTTTFYHGHKQMADPVIKIYSAAFAEVL